LASELIELSTRYNLVIFLHVGTILRGWARSAVGDTVEGISWIEQGIEDYRASGTIIGLTYFLAAKAEALYLADRTSEALKTLMEAEAIVERSGFREWHAELHRLRGVFLTAIGADKTHIETSFCEAIRIAREQKSISLGKRAEGTYGEYRRQKAARHQDVDSDYLFGNFLQFPAFRSTPYPAESFVVLRRVTAASASEQNAISFDLTEFSRS
jgi:hypothetical protein